MSSTGQAVGMVVGGVIGFFAGGNVALGASIGGAIGGYIDPPKGPKGRPPSASDLAVQTATYGAPLGRGYGTYATLGNIFWVEGNTLRAEEHEAEGGKGGGAQGATTYDIYGTFAVGFGEGEIAAFGKIWFGSKLITAPQSTDLETLVASVWHWPGSDVDEKQGTITLYTGSPSQLPDPRIQSDMGAANTPAYRGLHYIVVKDWPMADFGNSLMGMQVKAEIIHTADTSAMDLVDTQTYTKSGSLAMYVTSQNSVNGDYNIFNIAEKITAGSTNPATFESLPWSYFSAPTVSRFETAYGVSFYGEHINHSPTNLGLFVHTGYTYYLNGAEWGTGSILMGQHIWVEEEGTILGGGTSGGNDLIMRTYPGGDIVSSVVGAHVEGSGRIFVAGGVGYLMNGTSTVTVFDVETLAITDTRTFLYDNGENTDWYMEAWTITADESGRAWCAYSSGLNSICRFNETMTSFDIVHEVGHYVHGLAVWGGMVYTATVDPTLAFVTFRAYQMSSSVPLPAQLSDIITAESLGSGLLTVGDIDVTDIDQEVRGYKVTQLAAIRMAMEPLQAAWPFDVIPSGYKIKFVRRGKSPVATVDFTELGCVAGSENPGVLLTKSREMDTQIPRKVQVTYLDVNREYDLNAGPGAERLNTDAVNVQQTELAIVLNANEAAQIEEVLLYMYWLERHDVSFVLPPTRLNLEAADVITVSGNGQSYELRLVSVNYLPDGRVECQTKFNNAATYTSTAVGQEALAPIQTIGLPGDSHAVFLDIPVLLDTQDAPGFAVAMYGRLSAWPGGALVRTDDGGQTWDTLQGFTAPGAVTGIAKTALASGRTDIKDTANYLDVNLNSGALSSTTELAMLNGANHFAIGANGRWEIVAAQTCTQNGDDSWRLSTLLRGRFGTEWAMTTHAAGDTVVYLDPAKIEFVGANVNAIGLERSYRAVTHNQFISAADQVEYTYSGENLECLSPVYANGSIDGSNNWTVTAQRRTRVGGELRDLVDVSLGEATEAYEAEIWTDSYVTLKRTITGLTSCGFTYSSANQTTDFGGAKKSLPFKLYQVSETVGRGHPLIETIDRNFDPNFSSLVVGCHFNDTPGASTFTCIKGKTVTSPNTTWTTTSTAQSKFGGVSLLTASSIYTTIAAHSDLDFGTGNFTVRFWFYANNSGSYQLYGNGTTAQFGIGQKYSGGLAFEIYGASAGIYSTGYTYSLGVWYFIEAVRSGNTYYLFINGTLVGSATPASNSWSYASGVQFGKAGGYYDDLQVYKGVALHTSGFTNPIEPFADK